MRVPRVYLDADITSGQRLELPARQSNYLCKALRMQAGRELWLFNGQGGAWRCQIEEADSKNAVVAVQDFDPHNHESPLPIELAIALSKGDRFEMVLQKATELGVTAIQPMLTEHTDVKLNKDRLQKKYEHWRGILISACEQSGRNLVPELLPLKNFDDLLDKPSGVTGLLLDPQADQGVATLEPPEQGFCLYIGPEGGFSEQETGKAKQAGLAGIRLGPRVLRTETAPLAVISILQSAFGDFS
jgi:16S rRNA (uracil1498-N3)-methyltransferase